MTLDEQYRLAIDLDDLREERKSSSVRITRATPEETTRTLTIMMDDFPPTHTHDRGVQNLAPPQVGKAVRTLRGNN